jgi:RNA polymerase sigma factor (sigma-70 family)
MAKGQLDVVMQYLARPLKAPAETTVTDRQLLESFLCQRDEAAFAALVQRHARLVLGVAWRVLHDAHDAEDVFQAAFLVLARKAGSIRRHQAVPGWLLQVAFRLALKARTRNARRHTHERRAAIVPESTRFCVLEQEELRIVIDEELSHLPDKYRTPLVLHYLEGMSKNQTAALLGWTEGTVSGRLARARGLLRDRLIRRGFVLSCASVTSLLAETGLTAAVAPRLLSGTITAGFRFTHGACGAGTISISAVSLAEGMVNDMLVTKIKMAAWTASALVLAVAVAAAGTLAFRAATIAADPQTQSRAGRENASSRTDAPKSADPPDHGSNTVHLSASGKVLDDESKPVGGATVYLLENSLFRDTEVRKQTYTDILSQTTTGASGQFVFKQVLADTMHVTRSNLYWPPWSIVVMAKGYAVAWHALNPPNVQNMRLVVRPENYLRGRLLEGNGKPAVGVRVQLVFVDDRVDPEPPYYAFSGNELRLYWTRLPVAGVTDADGKFALGGLPRGFCIGLWTMDSRFMRTYFNCATIDQKEIERLNQTESAPEKRLLPDGFSMTLRPSEFLRGEVLYGDTGEPAVGVRVGTNNGACVTDSRGRYVLEGYDTEKYNVHVQPPEGSHYLAIATELPARRGRPMRQPSFTLQRGSVVTGILREKETGQPARVADVHIYYVAERAGRSPASTRTGPEGTFQIVVPPGKGRLRINDSVPGYVPSELLGDDADASISVPVDIKPGETLTGKVLLLTRGMVVQGHVRDPMGQPVADAVFLGVGAQEPSAADGSFTLRGLSPEYKNHFLVVHNQRRLGAEMTIEPREGAPIVMDVKLRPTQSATVYVFDENRKPLANAYVSLVANVKMRERADGFAYTGVTINRLLRTDEAGKSLLPVLVAGGRYRVHAIARGHAAAAASFGVESGEDVKVPDLVLPASTELLAGAVVDSGGKPIEGVEVKIFPRNPQLVRDNHRFLRTDSDGGFQFSDLPRGSYRLIATLWKPTGEVNKDGNPAHKAMAQTELLVEAGKKDLRIVLQLVPDGKIGKPDR